MLSFPFFGRRMSAAESDAAVEELNARFREAVVARDVAEQRCAELRASLAQARKDLESLRGEYSELLVRSRTREAEVAELRLGITGLIFEPGGDSGQAVVARAIAELDDIATANAALHKGVREFSEYLRGVIDALEPSAAIRREIGASLDRLVRQVEDAERSPSLVAGRGGTNDRLRRECRVLAVSDEFQTVILDAGSAHGVRLGMLWQLSSPAGEPTHRLRVVDLRATVSAAIPIEGKLGTIAPGMQAKAAGPDAE